MTEVNKNQETVWATMCHLSALLQLFLPLGGNVLGPLIVWLIKKNEMPLVDQNGKEALNFQISFIIYCLVPIILTASVILAFIGLPILIILWLVQIVFVIVAAIKVSNGETFQYPATIKFIK